LNVFYPSLILKNLYNLNLLAVHVGPKVELQLNAGFEESVFVSQMHSTVSIVEKFSAHSKVTF